MAEDKTQVTQEEIEKVAFSAPQVSVKRISEEDASKIDFNENLADLNDAFQRKDRTFEFVVPDGRKFYVTVRGLTSAERSTIKKNVYGKASLAVLREFGSELSDAEFNLKLQEKVIKEDDIEGKTNDLYETLLKGITRPVGLTRENLEGWDNIYINTLYDAIEELSVTPDNFREVDNTSGE